MNPLCTPDFCSFNKVNQTSLLGWRDKELSNFYAGEYWMRGGLCWPREVRDKDGRAVVGSAVVIGQRVEDGLAVVFESEPFVCVDHILTPECGIAHHGVCTWFNRMWASYYIDSYYCADLVDVFRRYKLQVIRSDMIKPKPRILEIRWPSWQDARHVLWSKLSLQQLKYRGGSDVHRKVQELRDTDKELEAHPVLLALLAGLTGLEKHPPRVRG